MEDCQLKRIEEKLDQLNEKLSDHMARLSVAENKINSVHGHLAVFYAAFLTTFGYFAKKILNLD